MACLENLDVSHVINIFMKLFFKGYKTALEKNPGDDKTDEEMEGTHSEDEMFAQRGLRRTQSMKSVKTIKGRKEASIVLKYGVQPSTLAYLILQNCFVFSLPLERLSMIAGL